MDFKKFSVSLSWFFLWTTGPLINKDLVVWWGFWQIWSTGNRQFQALTQPLCSCIAVDDVVVIFISKKEGDHIAQLVDNNTRVLMHISLGSQSAHHLSNINKTSVLFVSISFIVLMIISLAWLVFYYIQRFRYAHAKERLSVSRYIYACVYMYVLFARHVM